MILFRQRHHPTHWAWGRSAGRAGARAVARTARAAVLLVRTLPGRRVVVAGESMLPGLAPGDRVVVAPTGRLRPGDVIALRDPRRPSRVLVKRVAAAGPWGVDVRGDNPGASTDSRTFGPASPSTVLGRVVYRYAPPERAGRLGAGPGSAERGGISGPAGSSPAGRRPAGPATPPR